MKSSILANHPDRDRLLPVVAEVEALACARARRIVCVSQQDEEVFARQVGTEKVVVIPNGVDVGSYETAVDLSEARSLFGGRPVAAFLGSGHPPNIDAVRFILERLAPQNPTVVFLVIGTAGDAVRHHSRPANVILCGAVSVAEKVRLLQLADVAINPMQSGGGSSLKVADYLAAGLPLLSTPIGLRGFELVEGEDVIAADLDSFADALRTLVADPEERARLGDRGRRYAREHSDWNILAERYRALLDEAISQRPVRLLVSTFRFTDPPLGGAETYLFRVLEQLARRGKFSIDVATFDVRGIANFAHFGARYEPGPHATPGFVRRVHGFAVEEPADSELMESCRNLFALWQREELAMARRFAARFDTAVLLGGWYPVETYPDRLQRWTGERAEVFCPRSCRHIVLEGNAPSATPLRVSFEGRSLHDGAVSGGFRLAFDLGEAAPGILSLEAEAVYRGRHDARRLGICVTRIAAGDGQTEQPLDLAEDYGTRLRRSDAAAWIAALIETTQARDPDEGAPFQRARGPHSRQFEEWLGDEVGSYDLVLAHGIPFSHAVVAGEIARAAGIPYAVLPHYHMDDRYYHWQRYYELFRGAALTLAFPDRSLPLFFDRIGARAVAVAGGGIDAREFADLGAARTAFRAVHDSALPFVLVLGRKEANKGYHRVVAAVDRLRARGLACEVVLIGPDSDSLPIESAAARYYGSQPRSVVLGALAEAACLATMSESESFGIVVVEAWACGKPVIANRDCPAFAELIEDGRNGILCGNEEEIAAALGRLLAHPSVAARLGAAGQAKALGRYTWERVAEPISDALLAAAEHSRGPARSVAPDSVRCATATDTTPCPA